MATNEGTQEKSGWKSMLDELPMDQLKDDLRESFGNVRDRAIGKAGDSLSGLTDRLNDTADSGGLKRKAAAGGAAEKAEGGSAVKGALKGGLSGIKEKAQEKLGGGKGKKSGKGPKLTNIIEEIDIGMPVHVVYNQWTQFQDYSKFMKKVDGVEQQDETKVDFKAQVFWSHRRWEGQILEQVPDEKIVWRSKGEKGYVDGAVTFHELAPRLTRVLVVLEYHPQGLFERTGNLWRAQGRRARLELKHFRRHVMTQVILDPDELEGWRGEIHDGDVSRSHDEVVEDEQQAEDRDESDDESGGGDDEYEDEPEDEYDDSEDEPEDEYDDSEDEPEDSDEEPEDGYDEDEPEDSDEEPEDEYDDDEPEDEYDEDDEDEEPGPDSDTSDEDRDDSRSSSGGGDDADKPRRRRRAA